MDSNNRHPTLGSVMRSLRTRNAWTLKEMSERVDIPVSTLSKVEHDRLTLTYDKLQQLSQRLGMRMADLFADPDAAGESTVTARRSIGHIEDAVRVNTKNYDYYYLCTELRRKRMVPAITHIRAKNVHEFGELVRHSGEEYLYVLSGAIKVHTEFYDPIVLGAGESIYIDSNMGHAYVAEQCDEAVVLAVMSSADEGLMQSLLTLHGDNDAVLHDATKSAAAPKRKSKPAAKRTGKSRGR
ncbi:MAG: helix-turn-helix transcriptional regulator [Rudaea sp.]|uniref:helix-turn-helix domain-containing protein n=1 Tax=unclassified Rudaea TaxID=2627037 RepID=UPI0010F8B736|nr:MULTISPECIES: XRE family transcriptional regulator [unclassified Rudaea]MBN8887688.1 helix-turn-helix transcriptional regulator [Rudaea sp.]MBR0344198.1 helix-turn-helix transcriptional regulator [Rudaea sp.]